MKNPNRLRPAEPRKAEFSNVPEAENPQFAGWETRVPSNSIILPDASGMGTPVEGALPPPDPGQRRAPPRLGGARVLVMPVRG